MIFKLFFFCLFSVTTYQVLSQKQYYLFWPALNFAVFTGAYLFNQASWILNKKNATFSKLLLLINLPWLLLTWIIFRIQITLSKEDFMNQIADTNIWISSKPTNTNQLEGFDLIIDLTAEFLPLKTTVKTLHLANLDGMPLSHFETLERVKKNSKVLIHCANGHGRSSSFATILLRELKYCQSTEEGLEMIKASRPMAKPNRPQRKWLLKQ